MDTFDYTGLTCQEHKELYSVNYEEFIKIQYNWAKKMIKEMKNNKNIPNHIIDQIK